MDSGFSWKYYVSLLVVAFGASFQFYSACVVNPTEKVVKEWIRGLNFLISNLFIQFCQKFTLNLAHRCPKCNFSSSGRARPAVSY